MKTCSTCQFTCPLSEAGKWFYKKSRAKDGYHAICKICHRRESSLNRRKLFNEVMIHYGGMHCHCTGCELYEIEINPAFLTLDHMDNDGSEHRKKILEERKSKGFKGTGNVGGATVASWLKNNNYPKGFQVLCFNCNSGKSVSGLGFCPHLANACTKTSVPSFDRPSSTSIRTTPASLPL